MDSKFSIPADQAQAYSLMRTYGVSEDGELKEFLLTMLSEIKVLADYAKLADVAKHVQAAIVDIKSKP